VHEPALDAQEDRVFDREHDEREPRRPCQHVVHGVGGEGAVDHVADAAREPEHLGEHDHLPAQREPEAPGGEAEGQELGQHDLAQQHAAGRPEDVGHLHQVAVEALGALPHVEREHGQHHHEDREHGRRLGDAEPHDGQHRPAEPGDGEPHQHVGLEEGLHSPSGAHEDARRHAHHERHDEAGEDAGDGRPEVHPELALHDQRAEPLPDHERAGQQRRREQRRDGRPQQQDAAHGQQARQQAAAGHQSTAM
jgi:hypothetical protein